MVFIGPACKVLYSRYQTNNGQALDIVAGKLKDLQEPHLHPHRMRYELWRENT